MSKDGLLHKVKRAVIFQVLKQRLPTVETLAILGIKPETLRAFLFKEGFHHASDVQGPYKADLDALKEFTDVSLEDGGGVTQSHVKTIENLKRELAELYEYRGKYHRMKSDNMNLRRSLEREREHLKKARHAASVLRRALGDEESDRLIRDTTTDPTPDEIAAECALIHKEKGSKPRCEGEIEERGDKVYRLKFKGDRRLP